MLSAKAVSFTLFALILILPFSAAFSQEVSTMDTTDENISSIPIKSIRSLRVPASEAIHLDGKLVEDTWQQTPIATDFVQRVPNDGMPATERTEARVIYTEEAIYVGARAYDSAMDSVAATLFRKDGTAYSDWFYVIIDSYNDNRTGFSFAVNPKGVRKDILLYDDNNEDIRWDAVWEAATSIDEDGWTVEMRIPLSQLRFSPTQNGEETEWGINFQRRVARNEEISFWSPTPQTESGFVSRFGQLEGIRELESPRRLEVNPYVSSNLTRTPGESSNPFYNQNDLGGSIGADIKYGLTSDLTLTATINPDFGQVEADPAVINLSAYETYFDEQRPFFLEGNEIFQFGRTRTYNTFGNPLTFYSRRIGRAPQGSLDSYNSYQNESLYNPDDVDDLYTNLPDQTTIAAAAKVSGKTRSGWSVGLLNAFTTRESSPYQIEANGPDGDFTVEPTTNYLVARTKKDINGGNSVFGGFFSAANRDVSNTYFEDFLHSSAYLAGVDFEHNWNDRDWVASGTFSASQVNGSAEAIEETQKSSARYFNRVDSDKLNLDPEKNSLNGFATEVSLQKRGGEHWRSSLTYSEVSPGYEVNDLGFENRADYRALAGGLIYVESAPSFMRYYEFWTFEMFAWNYDGNITGNYYNTGTFMRFKNLWTFNFNFNYTGKTYNDRLTRGGPIASRPKDWNFNFNIRSDQTKKVSYGIGGFYRNEFNSYEIDRRFWGFIEFRPTTYIQLEISPEFGWEIESDQYVTDVEDELATHTFGTRYVFSDLDLTYLSTSIRLDWTFTPDMSLQFYARPYINSGNFYNFKEFSTPREYEFDVYGEERGTITYSNEDEEYTVDPDGDGTAESFTFSERDYNFRSIQGNTVFRWEYRPGSTLFLVWQHDRSSDGSEDNFRFSRDFRNLFDSEPTNIFLVKLSYWFGS
ncbi:DUF5916 domain-containing protein [Rhodohalobacter sp. 614A]|uniref:DUF5916 domain-containing protein n=1 Tax=Rhodohalobacter sp. 614A TaxID=2908649 RepID=UPI001F37F7C4|nr:DUF5916 domain-containing protein [Rhodohalobacter sp. 614A]